MQSESQVQQQSVIQLSQAASTEVAPNQSNVSNPAVVSDSSVSIEESKKRKKKEKDPFTLHSVKELKEKCAKLSSKVEDTPGWARAKKEFLVALLHHLTDLKDKKEEESEKRKAKKLKSSN